MSAPTCPRCGRTVGEEDFHVAKDVAYCRSCEETFSFADLVRRQELVEGFDISRPPRGVNCDVSPVGLVMKVSHRSLGAAVGLGAMALFWNGITSIFVLLALSSTLHHLGVNVPEWFPAPKMDGKEMSTGMTLFLWIFLLPFIGIGAGMIAGVLMALAGKTVVSLNNGQGSIFTGIGMVGWNKRFTPSSVSDVSIDEKVANTKNRSTIKREILIWEEDGREVRFGSQLPEERRKFIAAALVSLLCRGEKKQ